MARQNLAVLNPPTPVSEQAVIAQWQSAETVVPRSTDYLLPNRLRAACLAIVEGDTSVGKTTFLAGLAATVSTGRPWLRRPKATPGRVLWLTAEEDPGSLLRPRLLAAGADLSMIRFPAIDQDGEVSQWRLPDHTGRLGDAIRAHDALLVIVEPLVSYVGAGFDLNLPAEARAVCDPLQQLAMATSCTIVATRGLRKDRSGPRTMHGAGSAQIGDTARSVLCIDWPDRIGTTRVLRTVKCAGTALPPAVAYALVDRMGAAVMAEVRDLSDQESAAAEESVDIAHRAERMDAEDLLRAVLADGWVPVSTVMRLAGEEAISPARLRSAREALGVISRRVGFGTGGHRELAAPIHGFPPVQGGARAEGASMTPMVKTRRKRTEKSIHAIDAPAPARPPGRAENASMCDGNSDNPPTKKGRRRAPKREQEETGS